MGRYHRLGSCIVIIGPNDRRIHGLEAVSESLLCTQYIPPGISPCFGRVDDLMNEYQHPHLGEDDIATYLGEHLISLIEVIEQYSDLGFIRTPRQEFAKSPLHALHIRDFERGKTDWDWTLLRNLHRIFIERSCGHERRSMKEVSMFDVDVDGPSVEFVKR